jgi:hypothetical protein
MAAFGTVLLAAALTGVFPERSAEAYNSLLDARLVLAGLALALWIPGPHPRADAEPAGELPAWIGAAMVAAGAVILVVCDAQLTVVGHSGFVDEILYIFQGRQFALGRLRAPLPEELQPFFALVNTVASDQAIHTQYTPGWPAWLAVLTRTGLFAAPWLFGVMTLLGVFWIGRRVGGPTVGAFAALALTVNPWFLRWGSGYLAHMPTACLLVWMAALMLVAERLQGWRWWSMLALAGALGGIAFTMRPLTALALGAAVWLWMGLRSARNAGAWLTMTAALVAGALPPLFGFLWVNAVTNGSPTTMGYTAAHAGGHSLGFSGGVRIRYNALGEPVLSQIRATPRVSVSTALHHFIDVMRSALPLGLLLGITWSAWRAGLKFRGAAFAFLLFPAAYFFWPTATTRTVSEVTPFLCLGIGFVLATLWKQGRAWTRWVLGVIVVASVVYTPIGIRTAATRARTMEPYLERVRSLAEQGPVVVFVNRGELGNDSLFEQLWLFNALDWMGNVVVARDLGARNSMLQSRFPAHKPYVVTWGRGASAAADVSVVERCPTDWTTTCSM